MTKQEFLTKWVDKLGLIVGLPYTKESIGQNTIRVTFYNNASSNGIELFTKDISTFDEGETVELSGSGMNGQPLNRLFQQEINLNAK